MNNLVDLSHVNLVDVPCSLLLLFCSLDSRCWVHLLRQIDRELNRFRQVFRLRSTDHENNDWSDDWSELTTLN